MVKHIPVLLNEVVNVLKLRPGMVVVDATLGGGGYGREIVRHIAPGGMYIGIDRDEQAIQRAERAQWVLEAKEQGVSVHLIQRNFGELLDIVKEIGLETVDVIVADLGISSDQLEDVARGLSFLREGPLDMRLDRSKGITAKDIINNWKVEDIEKILRDNAQEKYAHRIAQAIGERRREKSIDTTDELAKIVRDAAASGYRGRRIDPATKTFMALRMSVNEEMESLRTFLESSIAVTRIGGVVAIVTFHSGEDISVKRFFRDQAQGCICPVGFPVCRCGQLPKIKILTKKPIIPSDQEIQNNPRSRSAKLRVAQRV